MFNTFILVRIANLEKENLICLTNIVTEPNHV